MTKDEFFKLLKKYERGQSTAAETELLRQFCDEVQVKGFAATWNINEKEQARVRLFQRITDTMAQTAPARLPIKERAWVLGAVAVLVGLFAMVYGYFVISANLHEIPADAITLELEDGTIQIIEEGGGMQVRDKNGNVVGHQQGRQLVYDDATTTSELRYNKLTVPYGKLFEIQLSDGTVAHLNAGSSLRYPVQFMPGQKRQVFISGEAYLHVAKDAAHPFIVHAGQLNVQVLGTQFNVHAYPEDEATEVVLVEGSVRMSSSHGNREVILIPGVKGSFDKQTAAMVTEPVITTVYTSWRQGELVFRDMPFNNILKKLERHYNVHIINENKALAEEKFNASFGNVPIEHVFENLKKYHGIAYTWQDGNIIVK